MMRRSRSELLFDCFNTIVLLLVVIVTLYPFVHVAAASLSVPARVTAHQGLLLAPLGFDLDAYRRVLANPAVLSGYRNTLFYVAAGTSLNLVMTSLGAYVLSRRGYRGRTFITFAIAFTMFFSGGLIPFYLVVRQLGLADTPWALILPPAVNTYNMIVMRTAFAAVPESLEESARLDGANDFTILVRIIAPLSVPVIAVMALFYGAGHWNAWFYAMVFLRRRELYPLQLILREILIISSTDSMTTNLTADKEPIGETIKYATIIVATVPILLVYPFLQKYFVRGIMIGALKG